MYTEFRNSLKSSGPNSHSLYTYDLATSRWGSGANRQPPREGNDGHVRRSIGRALEPGPIELSLCPDPGAGSQKFGR